MFDENKFFAARESTFHPPYHKLTETLHSLHMIINMVKRIMRKNSLKTFPHSSFRKKDITLHKEVPFFFQGSHQPILGKKLFC